MTSWWVKSDGAILTTNYTLRVFVISSQMCSKQVPFGSLAFMPGKLVHTNEITVLLGDNWFAKCSAKQAQKLVTHRMERKFAVLFLFFFPLRHTAV